MRKYFQRIFGAEKVIAEITGLFHFSDLFIEEGSYLPELAAQIDISRRRADRVGCDGQTFEELERIAFHKLAILESTRLGFICVGDNIMRPVLIVNEGPLHPCGKSRSAAAA